MLAELSVDDFAAIPYLETSSLMKTHRKRLSFSTLKPNVVVGPNGSGKTALLDTLAIRFLTYFSGESTLDRRYVLDVDARAWWTRSGESTDEYVWLKGLRCKTDNAPALYYRPAHVPGNEPTIADAMMGAYWVQAQEYARLVERRSSGEQNQAVLGKITRALEGAELPATYAYMNWEFGTTARDVSKLDTFVYGRDAYGKAEVLKALYHPAPNALALILLDEPEQSLDVKAEAQIWSCIAKADCRKMQIIAATHSMYPLIHRDHFNLIETEAGFIDDVLELMA
jgi:ABC-type cobalamin/Fe3+-siderophores transport system ATPase subunit